MTPQQQPDLNEVIRRAAGGVARRYGSFTTFDDLVQDAWEWVLNHPRAVDDGDFFLSKSLTRHLTRIAKRAREAMVGPVDQFSYDRVTVEAVLPGVWDRGYRPPTPEMSTRGSVDPAVATMAWETLVADVRSAVEGLPDLLRRVLFTYYGVAHSWRSAANLLDLSKSRANELGNEAVGRIVDILNGVPDVGISDDHRVTGSRRVMSNAQARAMADHQWDGE